MKILSIDVGIKNLAVCLLEYDTEKNTTDILSWDILNLCNDELYTCCELKKDNKICGKKSKYHKEGKYYCKIHAKNKQYKIPTQEMTLKKINKMKLCNLIKLGKKIKISEMDGKKKIKKKDCLEKIKKYMKENYFDNVVETKAAQFSFVDLGVNLKEKFTTFLENHKDVDTVLIENQIGPLAIRMKMIQGMIMQHFIERNITNVFEISAANKLKEFVKKKTTYKERKTLSIKHTREILMESNLLYKWIDTFDKNKKRDDLGDCFLQARWYIKNKL
tara:strand:+ start:680 stop:1504 length:825 start_codon:yes stop_codon:yes gene_type:complete